MPLGCPGNLVAVMPREPEGPRAMSLRLVCVRSMCSPCSALW